DLIQLARVADGDGVGGIPNSVQVELAAGAQDIEVGPEGARVDRDGTRIDVTVHDGRRRQSGDLPVVYAAEGDGSERGVAEAGVSAVVHVERDIGVGRWIGDRQVLGDVAKGAVVVADVDRGVVMADDVSRHRGFQDVECVYARAAVNDQVRNE